MRIFRRRRRDGDAPAGGHRPPPPTTPLELGLSLRSAREREQLSLEDIRERTDVPVVDLDALEQGRLDIFHVEQAAVVGLWRYAEAVGLEPDHLVDVVRRAWPHVALSTRSLAAPLGVSSTPLAQLNMATSLLSPIVSPGRLVSSNADLGLSPAMHQVLKTASRGALRAVGAIGPGQAPAVSKGGGKQKAQKELNSPAKAKSATKPAKLEERAPGAEKPRVACPTLRVAPNVEHGDQEPSFPSPSPVATTRARALEAPEPVEPAPEPAAEDARSGEEIRGQWVARLTKVLSQRFGVEEEGR